MTLRYHPRRPKVGDCVAITFDDHVQNCTQTLVCEVYGKVTKLTRKEIVVGNWLCPGGDNPEENEVVFSIVRSAIRTCRILIEESDHV